MYFLIILFLRKTFSPIFLNIKLPDLPSFKTKHKRLRVIGFFKFRFHHVIACKAKSNRSPLFCNTIYFDHLLFL